MNKTNKSDEVLVMQERIVCVLGFILGAVALLLSLNEPPTSTRVGVRFMVASALVAAWIIGRMYHPVLKKHNKMNYITFCLGIWYYLVGYLMVQMVN